MSHTSKSSREAELVPTVEVRALASAPTIMSHWPGSVPPLMGLPLSAAAPPRTSSQRRPSPEPGANGRAFATSFASEEAGTRARMRFLAANGPAPFVLRAAKAEPQ